TISQITRIWTASWRPAGFSTRAVDAAGWIQLGIRGFVRFHETIPPLKGLRYCFNDLLGSSFIRRAVPSDSRFRPWFLKRQRSPWSEFRLSPIEEKLGRLFSGTGR